MAQAAKQRLRLWTMNLRGWALRVSVMMRRSPALEQLGKAPYANSPPPRDARELRMLRIRIEDNGPVAACRWRGVPGEDAAPAPLRGVAEPGGRAGFLAGRVAGFAGVLGAVR
jgi:hypothetical protein